MSTDAELAASLLSPQEIERLILALATARNSRHFTTEEAAALVEWARTIRFWNSALNLVLDGAALFDIDEHGEPVLVPKE